MALKTRVVASFRDVGPCPDPFLRVSLPFALFLEEEYIERERESEHFAEGACGAVLSSPHIDLPPLSSTTGSTVRIIMAGNGDEVVRRRENGERTVF